MHSANSPFGVVIGQFCLNDLWVEAVLDRVMRAESATKKAAVIFFLVQLNDKRAGKFCFVKNHYRARRLESVSPIEILVDLAGLNQILELFQPGETGMIEDLAREIDSFEQSTELANSFFHVPLAAELR